MVKMSDHDYNLLDGWRASTFKDVAKFGLFDSLTPVPRVEKPVFEFGTLLHTLVLERDEVTKRYAQPLDLPRRSNAEKEAHAQYAKENEGKILVDANDMQKAIDMSEVVLKRYGKIIERAHREVVLTTEVSGVKLKIKVDILDEYSGFIIDLKSTGDSLTKVTQNAFDYGYPLQAYFYKKVANRCGIDAPNSGFLFASKQDLRALLYECGGEFMKYGKECFDDVFKLVLAYETSGEITDAVKMLHLPKWLMDYREKVGV
jgi:hypothetical protein